MWKFVLVVAVAAGAWNFRGQIQELVDPSSGAVRAYEEYVDALASLDLELARDLSAGPAQAYVERARMIYMANSEPAGHELRSSSSNGGQVEIEALQRTKYWPRQSTQPIVRNFVHKAKVEKRDGDWKVVSIYSEALKKDGTTGPADALGHAKKRMGNMSPF